MYHLRTHCRACGLGKPGVHGIKSAPADKLIEVLDLGIQPLANDFCREGESRAGYAPLKVLFCPRCSLAQLSVVVRPEVLYAHYAYVTSKSAMMRRHFDALWAAIQEERQPKSVLEIGSNDGDFLDYARTHGAEKVLGVDPAMNLAKAAEARGIPTIPLQFNPETAGTVLGLLGTFDAIVARHVFCHVDNWLGFIRACETVSDDNTLLVIEAPYAGDTLKNCEFDQCLPPGQTIVTESGFKEIQDVAIGGKVLTHTGHFKKVVNVFARPYSGDVIEIRAYGQNCPLLVTPEHPVYVLRNGKPGFIAAENLKRGDRLIKPVVAETVPPGASLTVKHRMGRSNTPTITEFEINENLCRIMGFYLAEGYYYECKAGAAQVEFAFGKSESEKQLAHECAKSISDLGATSKVRETKYGWHVYAYGHIARLLHREIGTGAAKKSVTSWMFKECERNIREIVWAYIRGDGYVYRNGNYWRASTVSSDLAQGIALLANKLGFPASINYGKPLGMRRIHKNLQWSILTKPPIDILIRLKQTKKIKVSCGRTHQFGLLKQITRRPYNGPVHNIEVEDDSSYVTVQGAVHNCYHEHLSFLTYRAMDALLARTQFQIVSVLHFDIHGGTSALFLRKRGCDFPNQRVVREFIEAENLGLPEWQAFAGKAKHQINDLRSRILEEVGYGNRVAGLGASAKSTVWINACGFSRKEIAFIADNTPGKQLTVSPGTDIPIVDEGAILRELPDYVVLWAWNYRAEVLEKFARARELGVRFIIPVPTIEIV